MNDRVEELSVLARRGALSAAEASELEGLFAVEPEERFWHQAGSALDEEEASTAADSAAAERVVLRLMRELPRKKPLLPRYAFALPAAAAVLVASLAAAAIVTVRHARERALAPAASAPLPAPSAIRPVSGVATAEAVPRLESTPSAAPVASVSSAANPSGPELNAAELLSAAGHARRFGHAARAVSLLEQLQARFPNSPEASASDISLGKLKLQSGAAGPALQHFNRYLQRSARGSLAPEALWGKAQALSMLGNQAEARKTWADLAQRFPTSTYAGLANAKLRGSSLTP